MLVSIAIFMVVAVIAVSALLKIVDASRKSESLQDAVNNINFAMDSITRELRVGSDYILDTSDANGFTGIINPVTYAPVSGPTSLPAQPASIAFLTSIKAPSSLGTCNLTYSYFFAQHPDNVSGHFTIDKAQQTSCTDSIGSGAAPYVPIIDPSIVITSFYISVDTNGTTAEPNVFLYISGYTGAATAAKTYFDLQTTISERL